MTETADQADARDTGPAEGAAKKGRPTGKGGAGRRGRRGKASAKTADKGRSQGSEPKPVEAPEAPGKRLLPYGLAVAGGVVAFLGFAGFDVWPLAFVAFVPFFFALELDPNASQRKVFFIAHLFGFVGIAGGYYWLVQMLENFSGFPLLANIGIASIFFVFLGLQFALIGWLWVRARRRGWNGTLAAVMAFAGVELIFPNLFPFYYGASFHPVPLLMQIADLGGPILDTVLAVIVSGALYEVLRAVTRNERIPRAAPIAGALFVAFTVGYGAYRIHQVEAIAAKAPKIEVGLVQANMGLFAKRDDPYEGQRRHIRQTLELEREDKPDLIVWPESAYTFFLPPGIKNVRRWVMGPVHTPLLFGGLAQRQVDGEEKDYNTAYLLDGDGNIKGTYDKTYLLAFGEYMPFGEDFPALYRISKNTGHFTPGHRVDPLHFGKYRISVLICYEDILPSFVRHAVDHADPDLLINITNDAWFGDTHEPWIHLALAKFRAVEHHRYLLRATNSGVSAIVDPTGRVLTHSRTFVQQNLHGKVGMMRDHTLYEALGNWPGWLGLLAIALFATVRRERVLALLRRRV